MNWFIGVDGGGTKTAFAVSAADGVPVAILKHAGCSYQSIGVAAAVALVADGVREILDHVGATLADCAGCCLGMPCYGEHAGRDEELVEALQAALAPAPVYVANDVEVGWAGALECRPGIHLVAGTGSIAFGRGSDGRTARCGGWYEFFGDEGSCYHIGREAMSLFTKEADGRAPRGSLYEIVHKELNFTDDLRFVDAIQEIAPHRDKVADFQRYALQAAKSGDQSAAALYSGAADELTLMVKAIQGALVLPQKTDVSYSGGLFAAGGLILRPLRERVEALGCTLCAPKRSSVEGALILSIQQFN